MEFKVAVKSAEKALFYSSIRRALLRDSSPPASTFLATELLCEQLVDNRKVILLGAGNIGTRVAGCLLRHGIRLEAICDNDPTKWGTESFEYLIESPIDAIRRLGNDLTCVVAIWAPRHSYHATCAWLNSIGIKNVFNLPTVFDLFPELLPHYQFCASTHVLDMEADLLSVGSRLSDRKSLNVFLNHIFFKLAHQEQEGSHFISAFESQYFDNEIISSDQLTNFVDCGAFNGDTLRSFLYHSGTLFDSYMAFEPDPINFTLLTQFYNRLPEKLRQRIALYPNAIGNSLGSANFNVTGSSNAAIADHGAHTTTVQRLDDLAMTPKYIKMDLEGGEYNALSGAVKTISKARPHLGICVYHKPSDLTEIPAIIDSELKDCNHFVRQYDFDGRELVYYACPN